MSTNYADMAMRARYIQKCKNVRPPYSVNIWGAGALKVTGTYNPNIERAVLFEEVVVTPPDELSVIELKPHDRYDNDRIDTALDADEFAKYMDRLSTSK